MDKELVRKLLKTIGMPVEQQTDICVLTILAMANLKSVDDFTSATNKWMRIHDIIEFVNVNHGVDYAENSRETFRKQAIHPFRNAAIVEDNGKATNSPNYKYRLTSEFLKVLKATSGLANADTNSEIDDFLIVHNKLVDLYKSKKEMQQMPVYINGNDFTFSPGSHNKLQKAIIEQFAPRFAPYSICLYVGDTIKKDLVKDNDMLKKLGFSISVHDKMPDVVLYRKDEDWIYFIEAVDSVGPMSPERIIEINKMTANVKSGKIFVTAFLTRDKYKKFIDQLAWETEVWIANEPDHMIHLNGDKFLGPRK